MIFTFNQIAARPPKAVGLLNGNEGAIYEPGLHCFIQKQHDDDDHGQDDAIEDNSPENLPKVLLISWVNCKDDRMILLTKIFYSPGYHFQIRHKYGTEERYLDIFIPTICYIYLVKKVLKIIMMKFLMRRI